MASNFRHASATVGATGYIKYILFLKSLNIGRIYCRSSKFSPLPGRAQSFPMGNLCLRRSTGNLSHRDRQSSCSCCAKCVISSSCSYHASNLVVSYFEYLPALYLTLRVMCVVLNKNLLNSYGGASATVGATGYTSKRSVPEVIWSPDTNNNDVTCYSSLSQNHHHRRRPISCCISDWSIQMASSVFYKFSSRKDESRVTFDGTGISVFDLKREIILANNMGKANDFDLHIFDATSKQGKCS